MVEGRRDEWWREGMKSDEGRRDKWWKEGRKEG